MSTIQRIQRIGNYHIPRDGFRLPPRRLISNSRLNAFSGSRHALDTSHPRTKEKSAHASWYSTTVPAMLPVAVLAYAVYMGLKLAREDLAHEKYKIEAEERIAELEREVQDWQARKTRETGGASGKVDSQRSGGRWWTFGLL
ncbi:hypothetical protein M407DRAFT_240878 [Tulasnella calospora MUT 4182]|uniref:Uncharacterized protein n=1 Tax=Tulasnella calospora MUT 4182 TaxID=1051891 RepID=A0A0C3LJ37_9AGAM|nr:hypothetical protein M407DRAFT_240878 [Tulasnella calospora MUT 4182]